MTVIKKSKVLQLLYIQKCMQTDRSKIFKASNSF